jgi:hypothetical protein
MKMGRMWGAPLILGVVVQITACGSGGSGGVSNNPTPGITTISPASAIIGAAAQTLTINGTNFSSSSAVSFNGTAHTATLVNATQLTISLSASDQATLGSYPVVVTNPSPGGGASNSANFSVNNPVPSVASISPTSAPAGAATQTLIINGTNFLSNSTVTFNGAAHTPTFVNATRLTIALSASDQATLGSYPVVVTNPSPGGGPSGRFSFNVTSAKALSSSTPSNALGVLIQGTNVTAYVPNGSWATTSTGVQVVPIEPLNVGLPQSISTRDATNSCASNSVTGETVCAANGTDIYLITGSTINTTLTSGSNAVRPPGPVGCENCGVAIDAVSNTAIISMGLSSAVSGTGIQLLNLANNTFATPYPAVVLVGEAIQTDPCRNIILSASEQGVFDVFNTSSTPVTEFADAVSGSLPFDSGAEDCATGIAMAPIDDTTSVYLTDLTQATFTPGFPNETWTAPHKSCRSRSSPALRKGQMPSLLSPVLTWRSLQVNLAGTSLVFCCYHPHRAAASPTSWITLPPRCQALRTGISLNKVPSLIH